MRFNWEFDYIKVSKYFYTFSIVITLLGILSLAVFGLNYGVDFRSGSNVDVSASKTITTEEIEPVLEELGLADDEPAISAGTSRVSIRFSSVLNEEQEASLKSAFNEQIDPEASFEVNTVDPEMAKELGRNAIYAVLIASLGILIYVTIRFEWRFAVAAIVALLHDAFVVISIFSIFRWEVDLTFITAVLTIVGFSINDTIVVFDRIRENLRFTKIKSRKDVNEVVNRSIAQTMTRSLNTTITVFIASLFLFLLGGESIRMFSLAMVIGLVFGAYSSIFIASPLWAILKNKQKPITNNPAKSTS
ncbi:MULTISPECIES: protein translocase subunit SecF [unclassified Paenibacillus]|uniref:Protein-export membrane protein SecF n=1 Tax=Paenibacillus provencensis TaxID=441151 RepID=A0ABW3PV55_9BACL|nr:MULTISPECIES: protein translocase subunit SecF [unclassified Paenibacillus]MCM3129968.1 protein translocase subunit SecF [Paenibacillus sp. MER 78]SFS62274.1 SecD/SecF fusion protein [Paenibacillus sp. 453mf]